MKRFETLLLEKELTPAQKKAKELGLKYRGFGYWQDPKTGKTAYKTEGEELVPIDHEKQMELDDEDDGLVMGDPLGQRDTETQPAIPAGSNILGAPAPGMERPSHDDSADGPTETGWDAGPDGDNMVNDQNKSEDEIAQDAYVGSNNNLSWIAGPDGSNFKNLSFDQIIDEAQKYITEVTRSQRTQGAKELNSGLNTHGAELMARNKRQHNNGPVDPGHTEWWEDDGVGSTSARRHAKKERDKQQEYSDVERLKQWELADRNMKIMRRGGGAPMSRTSYWKGEGYGTKTASGKARDIRHIPTASDVKGNKTEFWKKAGHDPDNAKGVAKAFRKAVGDGVSYEAELDKRKKKVEKKVETKDANQQVNDIHADVMKELVDLLGSNKPIPNKGYTGAQTQIYNLKNKGGGRTERNALIALDKLSGTEQEKQLNSLERLAQQPSAPSYTDPDYRWHKIPAINDRERARNVQQRLREFPKVPQQKKDQEVVKKMNEDLRELLSDPNINLDYEGLRELGSGAFGSAYLGPDKSHVIKKGSIGAKELKVLHKLKDSPYFPTLLNAIFESPFSNRSSALNNPYGASDMARAPGEEYYPADNERDWAGPTATGTYAMSTAKGRPWAAVRDALYGEEKQKRVANIWRAREALHRAGVSHNDMHASNVFIDDEGNPTILDLGLANDDPMSAFQEALAGYSDNDYQMARQARFDALPREIRDKMGENYRNLEAKLIDRLGVMTDPSDDNYDPTAAREFNQFLRGGIRLKDEELKDMRKKYDLTDEELIDFIGQLYDGLTPKEESELEQRMSAAYDQRVADNEIMGNANRVRERRGVKPLTLPRNVIPSKNLDRSFDHDD